MCGITGFVQDGIHASEARARATAMADRIAHRGPDGSDTWVEGEVALGHRRLAIVDLSPTGEQPMTSASGRYVIVFNGEIYNHEAMRTELARAGATFRGTSDTEVLLALIDTRGVRGAIDASVGMFAFALWDRQQRVLTLARDRMGEKPLYYGWQADAFLFGSELKALRAHPDFSAGINRDAVAQLLRWAYVPAPHSIYESIHKLRAGELLELSVPSGAGSLRGRCRASLHRYWRIEEIVATGLSDRFTGTLDEAADALDDELSSAVRLQLRSDVPLGAFLSGGIDSSLVVALMQKQVTQPVRTFSIGFHEPKFDESAEARRVAAHLKTEHTELRVTPAEARAVIPQLPQIFDEPFADASQIPTFLVSKLARQHVTVSLSGDGGDELFGGYAKYAVGSRLTRVPRRRGLAALLSSRPATRAARLSGALPGLRSRISPRRLTRLARMLGADDRNLARMLSDNCPDVGELFKDGDALAPSDPPADVVADVPFGVTASLADLGAFLPEDVLVKVDRASMSVSLESRAPMLDHRVVQLACRLPWILRGGAGNDKLVLRHLLYRNVPRALVDRPKMGFSVPIAAWLRNELRPWAESLFHGKALDDDPFLDARAVRSRWQEHCDGLFDRSPLLWSVLIYLAWRTAAA